MAYVACILATLSLLPSCTQASGGGSSVEAVYTISGTISAMAEGQSVVLLNNLANASTISTNGTFAFSTALENNATYSVSVQTQPATQT